MSAYSRRARAVLASLIAAVALAGCSAPAVSPSETVAASEGATAAPTPVDTTPALDPSGDAAANLAFFDYVNYAVVNTGGDHTGSQFTSALVAAGFDVAQMEVTPDTTAADLAAASVQFSVLIGSSCLIGQWGSDVGYHSIVTSVLASGRCLIGSDRPVG